MKKRKKVALPRFGEYNCVMMYIVEQGFGCQCIMPPPLTKRSTELGARNSPDLVCTPFKTTLGSMIEALESGAETLIMVPGACRLNYFAELQEQILRDMGYTFDFVNLSLYNTGKKKDFMNAVKAINPEAKLINAGKAMMEGARMLEHLDEITGLYYRNCGFDPSGTYPKIYRKYLADMYAARTSGDIEEGYRKARHDFEDVTLDKPVNPLRIGIIGEYYTVMDPFSNLEIEQKLADMGVEVHRWMTLTADLLRGGKKNQAAQVRKHSEYSMGGNSIPDLWQAQTFAQRGFDGLVHVKSAFCMPETDIMPVLGNLSRDEHIPILYLT